MHFLVSGGAGYVGSHTVRALLQRGHTAAILDDFSTGHRWATQGQEIFEIDLRDLPALRSTLAGQQFDGIFHFAAKSLVAESAREPLSYYQTNVGGTANLLTVARENHWKRCVFSSTAAIYGDPLTAVIDEDHAKAPINVYGHTKLVMEQMLHRLAEAESFGAICLRYFNAAGAASDASLGEAHDPETHLIPNALKAASGNGPPLTIFGDDYPTPDGSCIRDYIHVEDLADAHLKAMARLQDISLDAEGYFDGFNLGNSLGFSVKEVFAACEAVAGRAIPYQIGPRREGDPPALVADATRARERLDWAPAKPLIETIVSDAWAWEQKTRS